MKIGSIPGKIVECLCNAVVLVVIGLMIVGMGNAQAAPENKRVLLIHSYHPDYPTFFRLIEGVKAGLVQAGFEQPALVFDMEFMDAKRFYSDEAVSAFYDRLAKKLSKLPPYDVILTADDIASQSAIQRQSKLFGDTPIVFFGVNDRPFAIEQNRNPNVTGVIEAASRLETAELALRLSPVEPLIIVSDSTPTGKAELAAFRERSRGKLDASIQVLSLGDMTFDELKTSLRSFSEEHSLILLSAFRDKTGETLTFYESINLVVANFSGPVFRMVRPGIGQGLFGGIVISHFEQGKSAAGLAASILNGESAANLRVVAQSPNVPLFDYRLVERYKISRSELPEDSVFINEPPVEFFFSKTTISVVVLIVVLMATFTIILLMSRSQLHKTTVTLRESEAYYRSIFENALYGIAITDSDFKFTKVNEAWCKLIGYTEDELLDNMGIADVTLPDNMPESMEMLGKLIRRQVKEGRLEKRYKTKSGKIIEAMTFVKGIYDENDRYLGNTASILDITERKRAESALKESEAKYRRIFESVENGYIFADMDGTILSVNPATAKMLKYDTPGLLVGKNLARHVYADPRQRENLKTTLMEKGRLKGHLLDFRRRDGEVISAECNVHLIYDEAHRPVAIEGTFRDVTERNRAEMALRESEGRFRSLIESSQDGILAYDKDIRYTIWNPAMERISGIKAEQVIGKNAFEAFPFLEEVGEAEAFRKAVQGEASKRSVMPFDVPETGQKGWFESVHFPLIDADQNVVGGMAIILDITKRKKAENELQEHRENLEKLVQERTRELAESKKKYEDLYENAPDMFGSVDAKTGKIILCNQTLLQKTGYSRNELIGKHIFHIYHPDCLDKVKTAFKQFQDTGEVNNAELMIQRKDGSPFEVILNVTAIRDEYGRPMHSRSVWVDISARKDVERKVVEAKEALEMANERLQELDRLKSMFIASMSHEFRTPLNSIIGFIGILLMGKVGKLEPKQKEFLMRANQSSKHLLALINDIIDISKIEAGKIDTFNSSFMLGEVIAEAVDDIEPMRNKKKLELQVNVPDDFEIHSDRKRVYQCILNYLSNAIKYSEKGWVSISARQLNGDAEIVVEDTGIGIAEKDLPKLFQSFERLDSSLRIRELGTGLGLYLTKKMASEILGGSVKVESQLGVGSKFFLKIPMYRQPQQYDNNQSPGELS
jgi:PAS domain S-box-containing protein